MKLKFLMGALALWMVLMMGMTLAVSAAAPEDSRVTLSMEGAKAIALKDAKILEADAFFTKLNLDDDDRREEYEVEFIADGKEYEYEIDAASGDILESSVDRLDGKEGQVDFSAFLTLEQAAEKALAEARLAAADVKMVKMEFDFDDGRAECEVEFESSNEFYRYKLDAKSGEILSYRKRRISR